MNKADNRSSIMTVRWWTRLYSQFCFKFPFIIIPNKGWVYSIYKEIVFHIRPVK